jgi:hypothetical protein
MADAAAYAQERGLKLVLKPHGGDADEMIRCLDRVKHPNFKSGSTPARHFLHGQRPARTA